MRGGGGGGGGGGGRRRGGRTRRTVGEVSSFGGWCRGLVVDGRASQCHSAPLCPRLCESGALAPLFHGVLPGQGIHLRSW